MQWGHGMAAWRGVRGKVLDEIHVFLHAEDGEREGDGDGERQPLRHGHDEHRHSRHHKPQQRAPILGAPEAVACRTGWHCAGKCESAPGGSVRGCSDATGAWPPTEAEGLAWEATFASEE